MALEALLGRGGEGEVYAVAGQPAWAAKILHPARRAANKHDKLQAMVARPPAGAYDLIDGYPVLTWPRAVLHTRERPRGLETFQGYVMARVQARDVVPFHRITTPSRRAGLAGAAVTWDKTVLFGLRLCHVVRTLHRFGYAVGDLNDRNLLVTRRFTPLLMDTDSFQVPRGRWGHYPSVVGDPLYWPPELLDRDLATYRGDRATGDRYALAVLLFQLYMGGFRPYQARGSAVDRLETLAQKTRAGNFPWASPRPGVLEPPAGAPSYANLPDGIRRLFDRAFVAGHLRPDRRPSADEWYEALRRQHAAGYRTCDRDARHVYGADADRCPWCADPASPFGPPAVKTRVRPPRRTRPPSLPSRPGTPPRAKQRPAARPAAAKPGRRRPATKARRGVARTRPTRPSPQRARPPAATVAAHHVVPAAPARAAWLFVLAVAFATPAWALVQMPDTVEKQVATALATLLALWAGALAAAWRPLKRPRRRWSAAPVLMGLSATATLALALSGAWTTLAYVTGAASFALGATAFVLLERRRPRAFRPRPTGWLHGAIGVHASYVPAGAIWLWGRV